MAEPGKDLALQPEPLSEEIGGERQINQLDGYLLFEIAICPMSQVHGPHAPAADEAVNFVCSNALFVVALGRLNARLPKTGPGNQFFLGTCLEKRGHVRHKDDVSTASGLNQRLSIALGQRQRLVEDCFDPGQCLRRMAHSITNLAE